MKLIGLWHTMHSLTQRVDLLGGAGTYSTIVEEGRDGSCVLFATRPFAFFAMFLYSFTNTKFKPSEECASIPIKAAVAIVKIEEVAQFLGSTIEEVALVMFNLLGLMVLTIPEYEAKHLVVLSATYRYRYFSAY